MIPLALFAPGHGIIWLMCVIVVILIFNGKSIFSGLLTILLIPLMLPLALISVFFNWKPDFIKRWDKNVEEYNKKKRKS
jgi:hypothetical protein